MLLAIYVEGVLFMKAKIFQGEELFQDFVTEYEANHIGEVAVTFFDDGDGDANCSIEFGTYDDYLRFEEAVNSAE